jgi:hypothetical protein
MRQVVIDTDAKYEKIGSCVSGHKLFLCSQLQVPLRWNIRVLYAMTLFLLIATPPADTWATECGQDGRTYKVRHYSRNVLKGRFCVSNPLEYAWEKKKRIRDFMEPGMMDKDNKELDNSFLMDFGNDRDDFALKFEGNFHFEQGYYEFCVAADDDIRLSIDGKTIIRELRDEGYNHKPITKLYEFRKEGWHRLKVDYSEYWGKANLLVDWWHSSQPGKDCRREWRALLDASR